MKNSRQPRPDAGPSAGLIRPASASGPRIRPSTTGAGSTFSIFSMNPITPHMSMTHTSMMLFLMAYDPIMLRNMMDGAKIRTESFDTSL